MTFDEAMAQLASARNELPSDAMFWCLAHWDEVGPRLVEMLDRYADGRERSEEAEEVLFFAIHLMGEVAETRAFAPLCHLAHDYPALDTILGDGICNHLKQVMISTFDGDWGRLKALIESPAVNEGVRYNGFEATAYLVATGRIDRTEAEAWLAGLPPLFEAENADGWVWNGWATAIALLGMEPLGPQVKAAFDQQRMDVSWFDWDAFQELMATTLADPERMAGFIEENIQPFTDAIDRLSEWYSFLPKDRKDGTDDEDGRRREGLDDGVAGFPYVLAPHINPLRAVGRNDPCPCGSGKKFKKCCLR
jgi:uncharacterized protein YecA (UPF0149 family)